MRLLIINLHLDIGGVETLLTRLIPVFKKNGVEVTLLLLRRKFNAELISRLDGCCRIRFLDELFPYTKKRIEEKLGSEFDIVFCTISYALIIGGWLVSRAGLGAPKFVPAVFQTHIYCEDSDSFHWCLTRHLVAKEINPQSMIFGNNAGRDIHAQKLGVDYSSSPIVRLFVEIDKYSFKCRKNLPRKKIVSIGKIISFKTYNFTMLDVISSLLSDGYDVEWHVYGDGPLLAELIARVKQRKLENQVILHGGIEYSQFESALADAFIFVGSGTSLIEAAACGVPALTTIEYSEAPISYGFISEIAGFDMIEPGLNMPIHQLADKIKYLLECDHDQYMGAQDACLNKAMQYSGDSIIVEYLRVFSDSKINGSCIHVSTYQLLRVFASFVTSRFHRMLSKRLNSNFLDTHK